VEILINRFVRSLGYAPWY